MLDRRRTTALTALALVASLAACAGGGGALAPSAASHGAIALNQSRALPADSPTPTPTPAPLLAQVGELLGNVVGCAASLTTAGCHLLQNASAGATTTFQNGLGAADLRAAYGLAPVQPGAVANGPAIAVVVAYDNPNAEHDLATYRAAFGLPACTSANGCFARLFNGGALLKPQQSAWAMESDTDLAMASAACPTCKLILVESPNSEISTLAHAEDLAAAQHPVAIGNSYGVPENQQARAFASHWNHPGIAITASAGDAKTPTFPATLSSVTAVGGSVLVKDATTVRGWTEAVWGNTGAGCSATEPRPSWQTNAFGCTNRAVADVSAVAAANPGIAIYDSNAGGWIVVNGTSVAAPFVAGLYAAAADYPATATGAAPLYANAAHLNPLPAGTSYTLGTPNGLAAF